MESGKVIYWDFDITRAIVHMNVILVRGCIHNARARTVTGSLAYTASSTRK